MDNFPGEMMRSSGGGLPQGLRQQPILVGGSGCKSPSSSPLPSPSSSSVPSRYEAQKRRDWNTFGQYLKNHRPPLELGHCSGAHVLEFLRYLDQFGKTKIHTPACPFFGHPQPPAPCPCPLRQAWGSLDALVGRLRAAFEENGGRPEGNPFGARAVHLYLREVRHLQAKARGIAYDKKKRKRPSTKQQPEQHQQSPQAPYDTEVDDHPPPSSSSSFQQHHNNPIPPSPPLLLNNMQHKHQLHYGNHLHYGDDNERYNHPHPPPPPPPFASQQLPTTDHTYHGSLLPYGTF